MKIEEQFWDIKYVLSLLIASWAECNAQTFV